MSLKDRSRIAESREALHSLFGPGKGGRPGVALPQLQPLPVTEPGFYWMTAAEYHADPCPEPSLSSSLACALMTTSPAHARLLHPRLNPALVAETAEHFDIGTVAHAALLEGRDVVAILDFNDYRTNAAKDARDAARKAGKVPLLRKVWGELERMLAATRRQLDDHEDGIAMFSDGIAEPVLVWREDAIWCRARFDWLRVDGRGYAIDDFKTTSTSADPEALSDRKAWDMGWDIQASFYRRGLHALTQRGAAFRFAVQEIYEPFALSVLAPGPSAEMLGDMRVHKAISKWRGGMLDHDWPAYPRRTAHFEVPMWLDKKWADREVRDAV